MDSIDKINLLLAKRGMSGADLMRLSGLSHGVYSQWNTRITKPSKKNISKIAAVLCVSVEDLLPDTSVIEKKEAPSEDETGSIKRAILQAMDGMTNDQLEKLLALIQSLRT